MTLDSIIVIASLFISFWIIYSHAFLAACLPNILIITSVFLLVFHHLFAMIFHLYNKVWAYASVGELLTIVKSVTCTVFAAGIVQLDRKSTRLNSSHVAISYAVFCLKKKKKN